MSLKRDIRQSPGATPLDEAIGTMLAGAYGNLSRRSFLSVITRKVMTLAGVALAARALPYLIPEAHANITCGLHGRICGTNHPNCHGGTKQLCWKQCCETAADTTQCSFWQCCVYSDYCGTRPKGCEPFGSGTPWCSDGDYLCTTLDCSLVFESINTCATNCAGSC